MSEGEGGGASRVKSGNFHGVEAGLQTSMTLSIDCGSSLSFGGGNPGPPQGIGEFQESIGSWAASEPPVTGERRPLIVSVKKCPALNSWRNCRGGGPGPGLPDAAGKPPLGRRGGLAGGSTRHGGTSSTVRLHSSSSVASRGIYRSESIRATDLASGNLSRIKSTC